jgi:hypothetical protein
VIHPALDSPFPYQGPLLPHQVRGRDDLIADLAERVTGRRVTALLGPRRYGKTSVLRRLGADLRSAGINVVWLDLYALRSFPDLAIRLDDALAETIGPPRKTLDRLAVVAELNLGLVKAGLQRRDRPPAEPTVHSLLDVLVGTALRHPTLIVIDEFSGIDAVTGAAGLLRTKLQHHYQEIGLVFAGSEPSTMRSLFEDREQPFYSQADLVAIGPLLPVAVHEIIADGWDGDPPPGLANRILDFTGGHPQRVMQLADAAWTLEPPAGERLPDLWPLVLDLVRGRSDAGHEIRYSALAPAEQTVLRIVAADESLFGRAADLLDLAASSAQNARRNLVDSGLLAHRDERLFVVDPLLADWLRRRFPI